MFGRAPQVQLFRWTNYQTSSLTPANRGVNRGENIRALTFGEPNCEAIIYRFGNFRSLSCLRHIVGAAPAASTARHWAMFSKTDPANNLRSFRVTLKLRSGESEAGAILVPAHRTLRESLNDDAPFIELETLSGRQAFVLKTEIARIDPQAAAETRAAERASDDATRFDANDARIVLGVGADATDDEIHAAWRDLAKAYHPDRLAALGLPNEILRHADRVLARINAAFQRLKNDARV